MKRNTFLFYIFLKLINNLKLINKVIRKKKKEEIVYTYI